MNFSEERVQDPRSLEERVGYGVTDSVRALIGKKVLPKTVSVLYRDEPTAELFRAFAHVKEVSGMFAVEWGETGRVRPGIPMSRIVDSHLERNAGVPLICSKELADEIGEGSLSWVDDDHYRLEGRPGGVLEILIPYASRHAGTMDTPFGEGEIWLYTEE